MTDVLRPPTDTAQAPAAPQPPIQADAPPAPAGTPSAATIRAGSRPRPAVPESDPVAGYSFTIVPHTHWDREWYLPFEVFRIRLARTVEEICDVLEADPRFTTFTLDGQAVILEDVVELRPDLEPRLRRLLAAGRLATGPGYVLPDEFLSGQEALVRNLLMGRAVCRRFGAEPMAVGYLPDTFGHVAQLPQVLAGFGLDSFIFWRGMGDEGNRVGAAFEWLSPDGTSVTAIRQLGSYGSASQLGRWAAGGIDLEARPERYPDTAADRLERFVLAWGTEIERTGSPELLLCNGSDHERIQAILPDLIEHAAGVHPETEIRIGSYEDHWRRLRPTLAELPRIEGELVGGRDAPVLRGINSARMPLKQAAERSERAILTAETLASLAVLAGRTRWPYPRAELTRAWREHIRNLPHDSISGCSVDETHRDMAARFDVVARIAGRIEREALAALAGRDEPWTYRPLRAASVSVVNASGHTRTAIASIDLPDDLLDATSVAAVDGDGRPLPSQRREDEPERLLVQLDLAGFESAGVTLRAGVPEPPEEPALALGPDTIGNGHVTVTGRPDGTIELVHHRTGLTLAGLHRFEDVADRGDEYNFCGLEGDVLREPEPDGRVTVVERGPLVAELELSFSMRLPARLSESRRRRVGSAVVPVVSRVRVTRGSDRVEFVTTVDNTAEDHRLRVRFEAPGATDRSVVRAEGHFGVVRRPVRPWWTGSAWTEAPQLTSHTGGFVAVGDLALFGRGLPEYEAVPTRDGLDLALTLLRCVGWLSRDDLATRPGGAGPTIATPDAQCPGRHTLEYAIAVRPEPVAPDESLLRESLDYRTRVAVGPAGAASGVLAVDGGLVTALKGAEDGDGVVVRLYSPGGGPIEVRGEVAVERVRLDETVLESPALEDLRPWEIRSLRLRPRPAG